MKKLIIEDPHIRDDRRNQSKMKTLVIGDPHIRDDKILDCEEYIKIITDIIKINKPNFIVVLGDVLHDHRIAKVEAFNLVMKLIEVLASVPTFVLMGNHDLKDHNQFLSEEHFFGPYKKWKNIIIVDKPILKIINDKTFVFCPYVPKGRFVEALNCIKGETWEIADCIFAHQEFKGCKITKNKNSDDGDDWDENYPFVISGHIHDEQKLGDNIFYVGSSMQQSFNEHHKKYVFIVEWDDDIIFNKIPIKSRKKRIVSIVPGNVTKEAIEKISKISKNADVKINISGSSQELKQFKNSSEYEELSNKGVVFDFHRKGDKCPVMLLEDITYDALLKEIVLSKNEFIKKEYEELFEEKL